MLLKLAGLVIALALATAPSYAETALSKADIDAFNAIGLNHTVKLQDYQTEVLRLSLVRPINQVRICSLETETVNAIQERKSQELSLLYGYQRDGKAVDTLVHDLLRTSRLTDQMIWSQADAFGAVQSARDGHASVKPIDTIIWRAVYRGETELKTYAAMKTAYDAAAQANDGLAIQCDHQSLTTELNSLVDEISGLRDFGGVPESRRAALIAQLPALQAAQADIAKPS